MNREDVIGAVQAVKREVEKAVGTVAGKERTPADGDAEEMIGNAGDVANNRKGRIRLALTPSSSVGLRSGVAVAVLGGVILVASLQRSRSGVRTIGTAIRRISKLVR